MYHSLFLGFLFFGMHPKQNGEVDLNLERKVDCIVTNHDRRPPLVHASLSRFCFSASDAVSLVSNAPAIHLYVACLQNRSLYKIVCL